MSKDTKVCFSNESYNEYIKMSNIESNIAHYYTLYTFKCLIDEIRIFYLITTFHFLIFTCLMFKLVLQTIEKQGKVKV